MTGEGNDFSDGGENIYHSPRATAIRTLSRFERSDSYIEKLVNFEIDSGKMNELDKGLYVEIVNGVIRWKGKLDWVLVGFYHGDFLKCLNIVKNALRVALYQILFLDRVPVHAAIDESVEIVKRIQGEKTAGIVNAVLRNIVRNLNAIRFPDQAEDPVYFYSVMYSHPRWMVRRWIDNFGEEETGLLLEANNRKPYIPLRINFLRSSFEEVISYFNRAGIRFDQSKYCYRCILLQSQRINLMELELFKDGKVTVQDPSASLAARLAKPIPGQKVLDLCAAPGGKSFLLAELMENKGRVLAVDKYKSKLRFIEAGAGRLGLDIIETLEADAAEMEMLEDVDIIFADVPCSGLGILSKKPDIKWKRERDDIITLSEIQKSILSNAARILKPGGILVYSTCTIEPEENINNIEWFLQEYAEFELEPAEAILPPAVCHQGCMQTFPHIHGIDGAFAARLRKRE